jgi:transcription initiation factor TFIID subunit 6
MMSDGGEPVPCHGFPVFSLQSLRLIADQSGVQDISDDVLLLISEDMTYRVREMISNSIQFTRHSARTKLSVDDVDRALQFASVDQYGSCCSQQKETQYHHESGIFFPQQQEVDLLHTSEEIIDHNSRIQCSEQSSSPSLHWLMTDGRISTQSPDDSSPAPKTSAALITYSELILKAILSDDPVEQSIALQDLRDNFQIQPVIGHIVNHVQSHVKSPEFNVKSLTAIVTAFCRILSNPFIMIIIPSHLKSIVDTLLDLAVMPLPCDQDPLLRQRVSCALSLLCDISSHYPDIFDQNPHTHIVDRLQDIVASLSEENLSAVTGVLCICLSCGAGNNVYDYLTIVVKALHQVVNLKSDCHQWRGIDQLFPGVAGSLISRLMRESAFSNFKAITHFYDLFYDHFSDSFTSFLLLENCIERTAEEMDRDTSVCLGWIEEKSGPDLLDSFYQTSEEVAPVCGKKGATNRQREVQTPASRESDDVSVTNAVTRSDFRKPTLQADATTAFTAGTIFENYAALPRNRISINIMISRNPLIAKGESDVAAASAVAGIDAAAGHPLITDAAAVVGCDAEMRHLPHLACRKKQRVRLHRNRQNRSHHSCSHVNCFL